MAVTLDDRGMLPPGRYKVTAREAHDLFVVQAPYAEVRETIWEAFESWIGLVRPLIPAARLWLDGGFVTHKPWAAPKDVDVCLIVPPGAYEALDGAALSSLLTEKRADGRKIQPMRGLVDSYLGVGADAYYWADTWTKVLDEHRRVVEGERKGFLEVTDL